jgi:hypothetical protein
MGQLRDRMEQDLKLKSVSPVTIRNYRFTVNHIEQDFENQADEEHDSFRIELYRAPRVD